MGNEGAVHAEDDLVRNQDDLGRTVNFQQPGVRRDDGMDVLHQAHCPGQGYLALDHPVIGKVSCRGNRSDQSMGPPFIGE